MDNQSQFSSLEEDLLIPVDNLLELDNFKVEFTCMICISLVLKPLQLKCCDHLICTDCLKKYIRLCEVKPLCPLCKHSLTYSAPNKIIMRLYSNLKIKCLKCEEVQKTENFYSHYYNECSNREDARRYCKSCKEVVQSSVEHKCAVVSKETKEMKLHEHCLKYTNMRKHVNYEKLGWVCDYCEANKFPNEKSYHCNRCGLDICEECLTWVKNKTPAETPHFHSLVKAKVVDWICDVCKAERDCSYAWSCAACDYDVCIKCYWAVS